MAMYKKGTKECEEATKKWRETMAENYGNVSEYMAAIGTIGGKNNLKARSFALNSEIARQAGSKGGKISRKGHKFIEEKNGYYYYIEKATGKTVRYKIND